MKLKAIALSFLLIAGTLTMSARMTDQEVIQYVKSANAAGKSEKQIGQELLAKGVTREQVERIKATYENTQGADKNVVDKTVSTANIERRHDAANEVTPGAFDEVQRTVDQGTDGKVEAKNIYGHTVFRSPSLSFEPNENIATPKNYHLGPGDEVVIDIWGESEDHLRQTISPEGSIMIAQLGPLYLNGMTIDEAARHIRTSFASKYAGVGDETTDIQVTLGQMRTIQLDIMGEVSVPGTYRLSPFSTVFHALYKAGGINDIGSMRNVEVIRNGKKVATVDIYEFLFNGSQKGNIRLQEGDLIIVPPYEQLVNLEGNVKRPMYYELKPGETLQDIVNFAGGFTGDAYTEMVRIARQTGRENELLNVKEADFSTYRLKDGDAITVGTILDRYANRVELKGSVMRPGMYALGSDLSTVRDLVRRADGLMDDAYTPRVMLYREGPDLSLEAEALDLGAILDGRAPDVKLKRNDVLVIASVHELTDRGALTIRGRVARPGEYPFAENTSIEDLIFQAGGLLQGASLARVDVSRRILDPMATEATDQIARLFTFQLKDGLLLGDDNNFVLEPYDIVEIRTSPNYGAQRFVTIDGEVNFTGGYALQQRNERISDIVKRAGGTTPDAYLRGARLMRKMTQDEIAARNETFRLAMQSQGEDSISVAKLDLGSTYSVGIELDKALENPGGYYDIVLKEGDVLSVPELVSTVKIAGDVMFPNTVTYMPGKKYKDYIKDAGGYGERANKKKTFIVYMNGNVAMAKGNTPVEPGCQIIVPSKPEGKGFDWTKALTITSTLGSLGTMAAAIAAIIKK